jgi:translation initiation factor IF-3
VKYSSAQAPGRAGRKEKLIADRFVRTNERIRAREVRVIDPEGKQLGIMPPFEALKIARAQGLDLVEVAPTATPPVCRIINYGKYLYQLSKRQHEARKHQKSVGLKEVKMRPRTSVHDYEVKRNRIIEFLREGAKVKATIMFRGREMAHRDLGINLMNRLIQDIGELGQVETYPKFEGPTFATILAPRKSTPKGAVAPGRSAAVSAAPKPGVESAPKPAAPKAAMAPRASGG